MASLRERVLALTEEGFAFPGIAAILNLTPEQVEEAWLGVEPPPQPSGGGAPARYFWMGAILGPEEGDPNHNIVGVGIDCTVPVLPATAQQHNAVAVTATSSIGLTAPGKAAFVPLGIAGIGLRGTDVVKPIVLGVLWQDGAEAPNWCRFVLKPHDLTHADPNIQYFAGDLTISSQSGEDFSVGGDDSDERPAIKSAAGGRFLATVYLESEAELEE